MTKEEVKVRESGEKDEIAGTGKGVGGGGSGEKEETEGTGKREVEEGGREKVCEREWGGGRNRGNKKERGRRMEEESVREKEGKRGHRRDGGRSVVW